MHRLDIAATTKTDALDGAFSPSAPAVPARADALTILPGIVSMIYVAEGMSSVLQGMKDKAAGTRYAALLEAMAGTSACAQMASMTGREVREYVGCFIGDDLVIGHFDIVTFAEGDRVKVIGSRLDLHAYKAHAVVRMSDGRLWLSSGSDKGRLKVALRDAATSALLLMLAAAMLGICHLLAPWSESYPALLAAFAPAFIGLGILCLGYMLYSASGTVLFTERIFRMLGFKKPWMVNLAPFSEARIGPGGSRAIYHLWDAFKAYGVLKAIPARR